MIIWDKDLYHSWGKSPKQKAREKAYNHQYYLRNKEKWKNRSRSASDDAMSGDWPARIRLYKKAIDAEYEALGRPLTPAEKAERDRRKKALDQEYQLGISSGAYQQLGLTSRPRARKKFSSQPMNRSIGSENEMRKKLIGKTDEAEQKARSRVNSGAHYLQKENRLQRAKQYRLNKKVYSQYQYHPNGNSEDNDANMNAYGSLDAQKAAQKEKERKEYEKRKAARKKKRPAKIQKELDRLGRRW